MELAGILRVILRILLILVVALTAAMSQHDDDVAEVGHPRWSAITVFALLGALCALASTFGYWWLTLIPMVLVAILAWLFKGRATTLGSIAIWSFVLQIASPTFSGQPFGWSLDDTVAIFMVTVAITTLIVANIYHESKGLLPDRPHAGDEVDWNPLVIPIAIIIVAAVVITITLAIIG